MSLFTRLLQAIVLLAIGAIVTMIALAAYVAVKAPSDKHHPLTLDLSPEIVKLGEGRLENGALAVETDARGVIGIKPSIGDVRSAEFPLLHIRFTSAPENARATVAWRTATGDPTDTVVTSGRIDSAEFWLYLAGNPNWNGAIEDLKLVFRGKPGQLFSIESMSLEPLSTRGLILSNRFEWPSRETWTQKSINFHEVAPPGRGPLNPVSAIVLVLLSALAAYALWSRARRREVDLRITGVVVVLGWVVLDGLWLGRLVNQASSTQQQFAGKSVEQKLWEGPDASLYRFISDVRGQLTGEKRDRLFVASSSDYRGMRAAYFLYPHNVYWRREGLEVPDAKYLRKADYIVIVPPSELEIDRVQSALVLPDSSLIKVRPVLIRESGMLLQVR